MDFLGSQIFWYIWRQPLKSPTNTWGIDVDLCSWLLQNMWNGDLNADFQTGRHIQKKHPFIIDGSREYKVAKFSKIPRTAESAQGWQQTLRQRTEWNSIYTLHVHRMAVREVDRAGGGERHRCNQDKENGREVKSDWKTLKTSSASLNRGRRGNGAYPS